MKKAINLYFANAETKEKLDAIKNAGFDGVLLGVYNKSETMNLREQATYCKKIGLGISMIHCSYNEPKLNSIWLEGEEGNEVIADLINQVEEISSYDCKNFVIHTNGSKEVKITEIGVNRIRTLLNVCAKYDINLNIENLYSAEQVEFIFNSINHKNLTFCYDCGHENFLTPNQRLANVYKNKITTTHLHDNHGLTDEHKILGKGNIDLDLLAEDLAMSDVEYLTLELKNGTQEIDINNFLKEAFNSLTKLSNEIQNHKS